MSEQVYKPKTTRWQRLARLLRAIVDPRALAHGLKVLNYFNYTHVAELRAAQAGQDLRISPTASFANGRNIVLHDRVRVGAMAHLWAGNGTARIVLGADTMIAPHVMITAANYRFNSGAPINDQPMDEADVVIGEDVWIGYGAVILPGTVIGNGAVIGAGAVVHGKIPAKAIVAAHSAEIIGYRSIAAAQDQVDLKDAPNPEVTSFVTSTLADMPEAALTGPVNAAGIDSFDLIQLRTRIETKFGVQIADRDWVALNSLSDIARLRVLASAKPVVQAAHADQVARTLPAMTDPKPTPDVPVGHGRRAWELTMPMMALSGLGESWLFKELGDLHWEMICNFLQTDSSKIADDQGDRLYATFTRIRLEVDPHLRGFHENESLSMTSKLDRYGAGFFFGHHDLSSPSAHAVARTMSTFAKYGEKGKNTTLMKGTPQLPQPDAIPPLAEFPEFGTSYRAARQTTPPEVVFECDHEISPPNDINGVGLLYFAAYPTIFDLCIERFEGKGFLLGASTKFKDIMYFANSDPAETLRFRLHEVQSDGPERRYQCGLFRSGDGIRMASADITKVVF